MSLSDNSSGVSIAFLLIPEDVGVEGKEEEHNCVDETFFVFNDNFFGFFEKTALGIGFLGGVLNGVNAGGSRASSGLFIIFKVM